MVSWISPEELDYALESGEELYLIDLRNKESYEQGHIRGAVSILYKELGNSLSQLPQNRPLVLYCNYGSTSMRACQDLDGYGYQTMSLYGGIMNYHGNYIVDR